MKFSRSLLVQILTLLSVLVMLPCTSTAAESLEIQFIDSATGYAVRPVRVQTRAEGQGASFLATSSNRLALSLTGTQQTVIADSPDHFPLIAPLTPHSNGPTRIRIFLDPLEEPAEIRPDYIAARLRPDAMLIQGFIVDDLTGEPLSHVRVQSSPSGASAESDARGFFEMFLPASHSDIDASVPQPVSEPNVTLSFAKPGYHEHERHFLETWPGGDWTYRIRLQPGTGRSFVDERTTRRRAPSVPVETAAPAAVTAPDPLPAPGPAFLPEPDISYATAPSNATVRVPRNIRVLRGDGVTVDYVTLTYYARSVLPSEWIASWGSYPGGTNSLNAGAVALRSYAIGRLNNAAATSSYDICGTSSCQVYDPTRIHSLSDVAVNFTANMVMLSGTAISATEYSAENNSYDPALSFSCPDGFTAPTGGCLYDPICAGQVRYGHGRGLCQWGSARWATGRRMANRSSGDATPTGYARRDWVWILQHYYPNLTLAKGAPLVLGDDVRALRTLDVRACPGGGITNGTSCALLTTRAAGTVGVIVGGPVVVTADGKGFTWYQVQWNDGITGWSVENYLDRVFSTPTPPTALTATGASTNLINLTWSDTSAVESGFRIERAVAATGPWIRLANLDANTTSYTDRDLYPGSTWFYRVQAWNAGGLSPYTAPASATTSWLPPVFSSVPSQVFPEEAPFSLALATTAAEHVQLITDFEPWPSETANGVVLFRNPRFSGSTVGFLNAQPDLAAITDAYYTNGHGTGQVLRVTCEFTNTANPWLRLTTAGTATFPNPVIDLSRQLRFRIFADKPIQVAIACRETVTPSGTPIGSDGGTTGSSIEWIGVTNKAGTAPITTRWIAASNWTTVTFDFARESIMSFSAGNGVLATASGLAVLEHLAIVPMAGPGVYNVLLDNFAVVTPGSVTYATGSMPPAGMNLSPATGLLTWTPTELQGPGTYQIPIVATDNHNPPGRTTNTLSLVVTEVNRPPLLTAIPDRAVHAGSTVVFTNVATDSDLPANALTFSIDPGAPPTANIGAQNGLFSWTTPQDQPGATYPVTVRVTDNGSPPLSATRTFQISVLPQPALDVRFPPTQEAVLSWLAIPGTRYRLESKTDLLSPDWTALVPDIIADSPLLTITNSLANPPRFFRLRVLD